MNVISFAIDFILHMDHYLTQIINSVGGWTYLVLFVVIFIETGLVFTPFLPGDSLLFAAGALSALPGSILHVQWMYLLLAAAAVLGDTANYWIGHFFGRKLFGNRFLKKEHLERTQTFYEKHGNITIFLARFIPIIRTFAPFVAGIGKMSYVHFITYNIFGGVLWTALFIFGGYFFGNLPFVQDHFSLIVIAIIFLSLLPAVYEVIKARMEKKPGKVPESESEIQG